MPHERFDRELGIWLPIEEWHGRRQRDEPRSEFPAPQLAPVFQDYRSPLGTGPITSRNQRRDDLKRGNCREVDPSEYKHPPVKPRAKWLNAQSGAN